MSDPSSTPREKLPSRFSALFRRKWSGKDVAILALALSFVSMSAFAFREPISAAFAKMRAGAQGGETVSVFDVVVDRQNRQYFDILFDKPLGQGKVGEVLDSAPASIFPALGGSWKWQDTNALRFEPSGGLPVASEFKVEIEPEKVIQEGQVFTGETEVKVKTDKFLVEEVTVFEEPALEGKGKVTFRGEMKFNYPVDPKTLAPLVKVVDSEVAEPTPVVLETDWNSNVIGYRTEPVQKQRDERTVKLVIAGVLTPSNGNSPLGEEYVKEIEVGSSTKLAVRGVETEPGPRESTLKVTLLLPDLRRGGREVRDASSRPCRRGFSAERNILSITGEMEPGTSYKLTIGKGMPATDEAVLQEEYQEDVDLPDLEPSVAFQSQGMFLWRQGRHAVALETVNVAQAPDDDRPGLSEQPVLPLPVRRLLRRRVRLLRRAQARPGRPPQGRDAQRGRRQEQAEGSRRSISTATWTPRSPASTACPWAQPDDYEAAPALAAADRPGSGGEAGAGRDPGLGVVPASDLVARGGRQGDAALGPEPDDRRRDGRTARACGGCTTRRRCLQGAKPRPTW